MNRRAFLTALSAAPLAAFAPSASADAPAARSGAGLVVPAGQDRLGRPLRVFGGLRIDAKLAAADTGGDLYVIEHEDEEKGGPPRHVHHAQDEWFQAGDAPRPEVLRPLFEAHGMSVVGPPLAV